jgi:hypothetical protein
MSKADNLAALGSNVTTAGNISSASTLTLQTNSTTAITVDTSQNVGIGTTSIVAATRLDVRGAIAAYDGGTQETRLTNDGTIELAKTAGDAYIDFKTSTGEDYDCRIQQISNGLRFETNGPNERMRIDATGNILVAKAARGTILTDNDLSFDLNASSNFQCTPAALGTLTFTNIAGSSGQSGWILLINTGGFAISAAATTEVAAGSLATISTAGTYLLSYFSNGTNVYVTNSGALA